MKRKEEEILVLQLLQNDKHSTYPEPILYFSQQEEMQSYDIHQLLLIPLHSNKLI